MSAAGQLQLAPDSALPIDPRELAKRGLKPLSRGKLYNALDLDIWQRQAAEEALQMVEAGTYPGDSAFEARRSGR